jgi:hypothetical protein
MAVDRRVRLRPKDGARALYYGGGYGGLSSATNFRQTMLNQALGQDVSLPWLSNRTDANASPTTINTAQDEADAAGIAAALGVSSSDITLGNVVSSTSISGSISSLFGGLGNVTGGSVSNPTIMEPLAQTDGMVFPYTPTIDFAQQVDYTSYDPVHSNQEFYSYVRTKAPIISVNGKFTIQNTSEAQYAIAAIHFCRTVSKMAFGQSSNAGTPPPVLLFSAYGDYVFNDINVIMTGFNISYPEDVDYIQIPNSNSYLPAVFSISVNLVVQNTPAKMRSFSVDSFRSGNLLKSKGWT